MAIKCHELGYVLRIKSFDKIMLNEEFSKQVTARLTVSFPKTVGLRKKESLLLHVKDCFSARGIFLSYQQLHSRINQTHCYSTHKL